MSEQRFCPYAVLGVASTASFEDIKRSYQQLVRTFHPDKLDVSLPEEEQEEAKKKYFAIDKAWAILCDQEKRTEYDRKSKESTLLQEWPVSAEVDLDEMELDEDSSSYSLACRCGGTFVITEQDLENAHDVVCCTTCSLSIRVLYATASDDEDGTQQRT